MVAVIAASFVTSETKPWNAITYVLPAQVITPDNMIPESFGRSDEVPARLTRLIDCVNFTCPEEALGVEITARWQEIGENGKPTTKTLTVLDSFVSSLVEGDDYRVGENSIFVTNLNPFPVPEEVLGATAASGSSTGTWRIEGEVLPLIDGASPVVWQTQTFIVDIRRD